MPKISIIIPVYNVEEYLQECVDSVLEQNFYDYEILLVDDGSTDKSGELCDLYSDKFDFVKTIHKENGGLSEARNTGIKHAKGQYILFIDSDDYIFKDTLSQLNYTLEEDSEVEVVLFDALKLFPDGSLIPLQDGYSKGKIFQQTHEDILKHLTSLDKFPGSACTKLVKKRLLEDNNLFFEKGLLSEDIDWTMRLLSCATRYNYCKHFCYCYRQFRSGSITNSVNLKNIKSLIFIIQKWSSESEDNNDISKIQPYINKFMAYEYMIVLFYFSSLTRQEKKEMKGDIISLSWLLSASKNKKNIIIKLIFDIFGLSITSNILSVYQKLRYIKY